MTERPSKANNHASENPKSTSTPTPAATISTLVCMRKPTSTPIANISNTITTLRMVSASTRPPSTAERDIGNDRSRSSKPLPLSSARPIAVFNAPNVTVCTKIPGIR